METSSAGCQSSVSTAANMELCSAQSTTLRLPVMLPSASLCLDRISKPKPTAPARIDNSSSQSGQPPDSTISPLEKTARG